MLPLNVSTPYKCCTSMFLHYSAAPENSTPQGHELHLDLFGQQEPVLLLWTLHIQRPVLLLDLSTLQRQVLGPNLLLDPRLQKFAVGSSL